MCICLCMRVSCLESVLSSLPSIHMREISVSQLSLHVTNPQARQHLLCSTLNITSYMSNDKLSLSDKPRPWTDTSYLKKKEEKKMAGSCLLPLRLWVSIRLRTTDRVSNSCLTKTDRGGFSREKFTCDPLMILSPEQQISLWVLNQNTSRPLLLL